MIMRWRSLVRVFGNSASVSCACSSIWSSFWLNSSASIFSWSYRHCTLVQVRGPGSHRTHKFFVAIQLHSSKTDGDRNSVAIGADARGALAAWNAAIHRVARAGGAVAHLRCRSRSIAPYHGASRVDIQVVVDGVAAARHPPRAVRAKPRVQ